METEDKDRLNQYSQDVAQRWDELVGTPERQTHEGWIFDLVTPQPYRPLRVLDIAAGTGFHALILAQQGHRVHAFDASEQMIHQLRENASATNTALFADVMSWAELVHTGAPGGQRQFDVAVCLGSSIPHLADADDRVALFGSLHRLLAPGGRLLVDHRNFDFIVDTGRLPEAASPYSGDVDVSVEEATKYTTCFRYRRADASTFSLRVASLRYAQLRDEIRSVGFDVQSLADGEPAASIGGAAFGLHYARKADE